MLKAIKKYFSAVEKNHHESVQMAVSESVEMNVASLQILIHSDIETIEKLKTTLKFHCHKLLAEKHLLHFEKHSEIESTLFKPNTARLSAVKN